MSHICIAGTGMYVPERRVNNHELSRRVDTSDEWIVSHTGISARHVAADGEACSDLAFRAAEIALGRAGIEPGELGLVVVATTTPDYSCMPSTACLLQERLGARGAAAFDISAACSGFVYGLEIARSLMRADARPALVVGSEVMSRIVDWSDRNTCVLFGDGAGAAVLTASERPGILRSYLRADGSGAKALYREGGSRMTPEEAAREPSYLVMNGRVVFNFAVKAMAEVVQQLLGEAGLTTSDVDWIVPHQANFRIIQAAAKRLGLSTDRFFLNIADVANTSGASIPIALDNMSEQGLLKPGDLVVTVGFGAGLTYGGNLLYW